MTSSRDRIERQVVIKAPRSRVWQVLTNPEEFGKWFGVALRGRSFTAGQRTSGQITYPGYEHLVFEIWIERVEPERIFSWRWHPYAIDPQVDYSQEPTTLVEFALQEAEGGTLLTVVESGFDKLPEGRRPEAFRMNCGGWDQQLQNIVKHVAAR